MQISPNDYPHPLGIHRARLAVRGAVVLCIVVGAGCNRTNNVDQSVTNNTANNVSKIFGPQGGHLEGPGGAEIDLPPGALNEEVEITIGEVVTGAPETPAGLSDPSTVFAFLPHGQTFALDVTISVPHQGGPNANVVVFRADPGGAFEEIAVEAATDRIATVRSPSFSYYGSAVGETAGTDSTTGVTGVPGTDSDSGFIPPTDIGTNPLECDVYTQDCAVGYKCMPYDSSDTGEWDSSGCFEVDPDGIGVGAGCLAVGEVASGVDNCALGLMCWHVNPDNGEGLCVQLCGADQDQPCPGEVECDVQFQGAVPLCLEPCDPLSQDCAGGQACYFGAAPFCADDQSGGAGNAGDPCDGPTQCAPGNQCVAGEALAACRSSGCCTPFCNVSLNDCVDGNLSCAPLFDKGNAPPGSEDYGACVLPA